jgi:hypothetical protein
MAGASEPAGQRSRAEMAGFCNNNREYTGPLLACKVMFANHLPAWQLNSMLRWYVSRSYDAAFTGLYMQIMDKHFPLTPRQIVNLRQIAYGFMMWRVSYECNQQTTHNDLDYYMSNALVQMKDLCLAMKFVLPNIETLAEDRLVLATLKSNICFTPDRKDHPVDPGELIMDDQHQYYITSLKGVNDICARAGTMAQSEGCVGIILKKLMGGGTPIVKQLNDPKYRGHLAVSAAAVDDGVLFTQDEHAILTFLNNDIIKGTVHTAGPPLWKIGFNENEVVFVPKVLSRITNPAGMLLPNCKTLKGDHGNVPEFNRALLQLEASKVICYRSLISENGKSTPYPYATSCKIAVHCPVAKSGALRVNRAGLMDDARIFGTAYTEMHDDDIGDNTIKDWQANMVLSTEPVTAAVAADQAHNRDSFPAKRMYKTAFPLAGSMSINSKYVRGAVDAALHASYGYNVNPDATEEWDPHTEVTNESVKARAMNTMLDASMQFSGERQVGDVFVSGAPPGGAAAYETHTVCELEKDITFHNPRRYAEHSMTDMEPEPEITDNLDDYVCPKTQETITVPTPGSSTKTDEMLQLLRRINLVV